MKRKLKLFKTITSVYYWIKDSLADPSLRYIVSQGGTSSSKTYSTIQNLIKLAIDSKEIISIVAEAAPALKRGAIRDFRTILEENEGIQFFIKDPSLVQGPYMFKNGSIIEFISLRDAGTAKHGKRDYLFLNEANHMDYETAKQLIMRTRKKVLIDYNPDAKFWVHNEIIPLEDTQLYISNYTHNEFCPDTTVEEILGYKRKWIKSIVRNRKNEIISESVYWKNKWNVYGLGLTGIVEGVIFKDVNWVNLLPPGLIKKAYAIDWGFTTDPTTVSKIGMKRGEVYAKELIYERGLTTPDLMMRLIQMGVSKKDLIIADSSNPDAIAQMQRKGFNIIPAYKPPGSIKSGIKALQEMVINITHSSKNWKEEQLKYKWAQKNGEFTDEPIDKWNHLWDGLRYWRQYFFGAKPRKRKKHHRKVRIIN